MDRKFEIRCWPFSPLLRGRRRGALRRAASDALFTSSAFAKKEYVHGEEKGREKRIAKFPCTATTHPPPFFLPIPFARINVQPFSFFKENNGFRSYLAFHIKEFNVFHF